ncbi:hypothetical protein FRC03_008427 [Tulasnella sp. 419]|nr:hypothetical protein FRC03_008427 [Tulasnella sp. 419]
MLPHRTPHTDSPSQNTRSRGLNGPAYLTPVRSVHSGQQNVCLTSPILTSGLTRMRKASWSTSRAGFHQLMTATSSYLYATSVMLDTHSQATWNSFLLANTTPKTIILKPGGAIRLDFIYFF